MERYSAKRGNPFKKVGNAIGGAAKKVGGAVVTGAKAVGKAVVAGWEAVKAQGLKVVASIKELYAKIRDKIKAFLNSDFVGTVKKIIECGMALKGAVQNIISVVKTIYSRITTIMASGLIGLAKVFIDLVCNFDIFRQAVNKLIDGFKQTDTLKKFNNYGQFVGLLIKAIGTRRFMKMRIFLI
jgi:Na+/serine symporter